MNWNTRLKRIAEMLLVIVLVFQINPMFAEDGIVSSESKSISSLADENITFHQLSTSGDLYEITVTYSDDARISDNARLHITEFTADTEEYINARKAVQQDMNSRGKAVNASTLGLAALDISILDADGNEIEPAVPVRVDMAIKALPGVNNLSEIADTLVVKHHVDTENGVVVETVCNGGAKAYPQVTVSFQTAVFSTFTVEWGSASDSDTVNYLWATAANVNTYQFNDDGSYAGMKSLTTNNLHFMNSSALGIPGYIFRTPANETAKGDLYLVYDHTGNGTGDQNVSEADSTFHIYFNYNGRTYADVTVHYVDSEGNAIRRTKTNNATYSGSSVDTRNVDGSNTNRELRGYAGTKPGYTFVGVSEVKPSNQASHATIHYVDEDGRELTISNSTYGNLDENSTSPAYLIYDIEGYEYSYTYRNSKTNSISPLLAKNYDNGRWAYNPSLTNYGYTGTVLSNNDNIYVVYKKKNTIAQGGTPTVKQSGNVDQLAEPRIDKTSTPNGDDTNTLALSIISDTAALEVEKLADVIVVLDVSGSMSTNDMGGKTRLKAAQDAVNDLAERLAEKKNSNGEPLVRMSLIQFSTKASNVLGMTDLTNDGVDKIKSNVNGLSAAGGTNWDHALQLANEENDLDTGRATFVIFVTDGDPTFRNTRMNVTDLDLQGETNGTDGPANYWYQSDTVYGPGDNDKTGKCYDAAVVQGNAIVSASKNIYTIGISNDVTKVETFNSAIHGNGAYLAANSDALDQAFEDIEASISGALGWGNIQMTDGITNLTNTVQKTGLVNVGGDFSYWIAPAPANWANMTESEKNAYKPAATDFVSWDPEAAGAALAVYNEETGAVEWNMGDKFMPEAGVTYQVRFKVWPSQEAYDYIAKLNNGTIQYDELPDNVKAQIIKNGNTYTLKTNEPDAKTTYQSATRTGDTVTASGETKTLMFPTVEDLNLSVDKMKVEKKWVNDLDPADRWKSAVTLLLTDGDGNLYKSIVLNDDNNYTMEDNFISCGLAKIEGGELIIYEKGHDFKLTEPENYAYYWDLDSEVYRPMIIDTVLTMMIKADAPSGMGNKTYYEYEGAKYYKIDGSTYKAISTDDAAAAITATNIRRSNLNLTKKVVDDEGNPVVSSEAFEFTITVNDTHEADIWFSAQTDVNDPNTIVKELTTDATAETRDGEKTGYYYAASGSPITVSIQPGWNLRFTNLPNGTTYTITESKKEHYSFVSAVIDNNGTFSVNSSTTTGSGTINESNTSYTVTYTNKTETVDISATKAWQNADGTSAAPDGAKVIFGLFRNDETEPIETLELDGTADVDLAAQALEKSPWVAEFKRLQKYDAEGHEISYTIKEIGPYPVGYYPNSDAAVSSGATITNVARALTVSKTVNGNLGSKNKEFSFTLTMPEMAGKTVKFSLDGGATRQDVSFNASGQTTFTLAHDQSITFYTVSGTYTVVETTNDGYATVYQIDDAAAQSGKTAAGKIDGDQTAVAYTNTLDTTPPTGIHDSIAFALISLGAAAGLMAAVCLGRGRKRYG